MARQKNKRKQGRKQPNKRRENKVRLAGLGDTVILGGIGYFPSPGIHIDRRVHYLDGRFLGAQPLKQLVALRRQPELHWSLGCRLSGRFL